MFIFKPYLEGRKTLEVKIAIDAIKALMNAEKLNKLELIDMSNLKLISLLLKPHIDENSVLFLLKVINNKMTFNPNDAILEFH